MVTSGCGLRRIAQYSRDAGLETSQVHPPRITLQGGPYVVEPATLSRGGSCQHPRLMSQAPLAQRLHSPRSVLVPGLRRPQDRVEGRFRVKFPLSNRTPVCRNGRNRRQALLQGYMRVSISKPFGAFKLFEALWRFQAQPNRCGRACINAPSRRLATGLMACREILAA